MRAIKKEFPNSISYRIEPPCSNNGERVCFRIGKGVIDDVLKLVGYQVTISSEITEDNKKFILIKGAEIGGIKISGRAIRFKKSEFFPAISDAIGCDFYLDNANKELIINLPEVVDVTPVEEPVTLALEPQQHTFANALELARLYAQKQNGVFSISVIELDPRLLESARMRVGDLISVSIVDAYKIVIKRASSGIMRISESSWGNPCIEMPPNAVCIARESTLSQIESLFESVSVLLDGSIALKISNIIQYKRVA